LFLDRARRFPKDIVCYKREGDEDWYEINARELREMVVKTARGLMARGLKFGEKAGLKASTRYEWVVVDLALALVGAVSVPIYETSSKRQINYICDETGLKMIFDEKELDGLAELWEDGESVRLAELAKRAGRVRPKQTASIVYTSGTTSAPKGVELTHANFIGTIQGLTREAFPEGPAHYIGTEDARMLQFLPLSHVLARLVTHGIIGDTRAGIGFEPDMGRIVESFQSFRPTNIIAVPRVLEKVLEGARKKAGKGIAGKIFKMAERMAIKKNNESLSVIDSLKYKLADKMVFAKLRAAMGGRMKYIVTGGAALKAEIEQTFCGMGLTIMSGYGLTETTGPIILRRANMNRTGSVGVPVMGSKVKIAKDGEILLRGPGISPRYFKGEKNRGWFHTGDLGRLDGDGFLYVEGRKKDIIVTSYGKNVNYLALEEGLLQHPLVAQAIVVGDGRPCVMGLVTLDTEAVRDFLREQGVEDILIEDMAQHKKITREIEALKKQVNALVSHAEAVREIAILAGEWTTENDLLTPTLKPKRTKIMRKFAAEIEELYKRKSALDRYSGAAEVFEGRENEENIFIGAVAVRDKVIYPKAYEAINNLRQDVYTKVGKTAPELVFDEYDAHAAHMAVIDGRGKQAKILYAFRVILHDDDERDIGLFLEPNYDKKDYIFGAVPTGKRGEIGRFVSGFAIKNVKKSPARKLLWKTSPERYKLMAMKALLYAKALRDYGEERIGYAEVAEDLYRQLSKLNVVEKISRGKVFAVPNDGKERFVVKFHDDALEKIVKKIRVFMPGLTIDDLAGDFYKIGGRKSSKT
jgi:long-chain acyl-CoA synthetase